MIKKVLFITPIPKINVKGGIASWTSLLIKYGLPEDFKFRIVDSSVLKNRTIFEKNQYSFFSELYRNLRIIFNLLNECIFYRPSIVHLNCSLSAHGVIKDFISLIIAKFFLIPIVVHYRGNVPPEWMNNKYFFFSKFCIKFIIQNSNLNLAMNRRSFSYLNMASTNKLNNKILESFIEDSFFNHENKYSNYLYNSSNSGSY